MWIVIILVAAFVIWHFIPQREQNVRSPRIRKEIRAVETDPHWRAYYEEQCESPAESAFLRAMLRAYDLKPVAGRLSANGLQLDLQVEEGRYRVDFLVDEWLVIEIDGAAYHSSKEAIERDQRRDEFFSDLGYSVLRIPAKVVFKTPEEAISRVRSALLVGKRSLPILPQESGWNRLKHTLSSADAALSAINEGARRARAIDHALNDAKSAFASEKVIIEIAVDWAKSEIETEDWLNNKDDVFKTIFEQNRKDVEDAINAADENSGHQENLDEQLTAVVFPSSPIFTENSEHNTIINNQYQNIVSQRDDFLGAKRIEIARQPKIARLVKAKLNELNCSEYWDLLCDSRLDSYAK